jgi:hypothetical protein
MKNRKAPVKCRLLKLVMEKAVNACAIVPPISWARREGRRLHPIMGFMYSELVFSVYLDCDESENVLSKFRTLISIGSR